MRQCWTAEDCQETAQSRLSGYKYCTRFPHNDTGRDLATIVFYKTHGINDTTTYAWNLPGYTPAWATLLALSGANTTNNGTANPIRSFATTSCDKKAAAVFPSVYGEAGDVLLLSMAHDDQAKPKNFRAPQGTENVLNQGVVYGSDEAGFVYAQRLNRTGNSGTYATRGTGSQWWCKDSLLSLTIQMRQGNDNDTELLILKEHNANLCGSRDNDSAASTAAATGLSNIFNAVKGFLFKILWRLGYYGH